MWTCSLKILYSFCKVHAQFRLFLHSIYQCLYKEIASDRLPWKVTEIAIFISHVHINILTGKYWIIFSSSTLAKSKHCNKPLHVEYNATHSYHVKCYINYFYSCYPVIPAKILLKPWGYQRGPLLTRPLIIICVITYPRKLKSDFLTLHTFFATPGPLIFFFWPL